MTAPTALWWRPLRVVIGAAVLAFCWFLFAPTSAQADVVLPGLAPVAEAVTEPVATSVSTVEKTVDKTTGAAATVVPATQPVRKATQAATTVVRTTTSQVTGPVERVAKTVDATVAKAVDETVRAVTPPVRELVPTLPTPRPEASPVTPVDLVHAEIAALRADRTSGVAPVRTVTVQPLLTERAAATVRALTTAVVVVAAPVIPPAPAPLQPLPLLASALVVGAVASSLSGRGMTVAGDAVQVVRLSVPTTVGTALRALAERVVPGPALIPGTSPD